jgi:hypothetical protein
MKVTKKLIDDTTEKYLAMVEAKKEFERKDKAWKTALEPIVTYVEDVLKLPPESAAELRGHHTALKIGKQRETKYVKDQLQALQLLEHREQGLGYSNIQIPLRVLQQNLALPEYEDLLGKTYGSRIVKAVDLD